MEERREKDIVADDITDITLIQVGYYWNSGYNEFDFTCKISSTITVPDGVDAELLMKVLGNPEMAALLTSLAKTMKV